MEFFVPGTSDKAQAESVYARLAESEHLPIPPLGRRLHRITFSVGGKKLVAEVGKELEGRRAVGVVRAIFDHDPLVILGTNDGMIYVGARTVEEGGRVFFDGPK